ncbi:erythromycin esterase family protein [Symbioplanes lichenis]|uniref:erythromycin esterase family protein n=1 Tax=Symbioplanes lichenis TaxID=1629072 RepID=UPI00273A59FC|nr:erythromycin esterase family protein [Actinoplanes lichenis]
MTALSVLPLDDLKTLIGSARVVAIGESAHFIPEYHALRHRMLRRLHEELGFTVYAHESGFSEGLAVDAWIQGGPGEYPVDGFTYRFGPDPALREMVRWMRSESTLRYAGLDLPADLASLLPALEHAATQLDPELVDRVRGEAEKWAGPFTMPAFAAYAFLPQADRDRLTVLLAELSARAEVTVGVTAALRHELRLAVLLDQQLRAQATGAYEVNVRDAAMAATVRHLLRDPGAKIVIGAANNHIQRIPVEAGGLRLPVLGAHLAAELGDDYVSIAVTSGGGRTSTRVPDRDDPRGATVLDVALGEPEAGSVEAALGTVRTESVADLRPLRATESRPRGLRTMDQTLAVDVAAAHDLVAVVPVTSVFMPV